MTKHLSYKSTEGPVSLGLAEGKAGSLMAQQEIKQAKEVV